MATTPAPDRSPLHPTPRPQKRSRTTWEQKLIALDPTASPEETESRVEYFGGLFVQRYTDGITTRVNQGPRSWTHMRGRIYLQDIVRHLLGDRIPDSPPIWIGARSFDHTRWFCLDVDPDRTAERTLEEEYDLSELAQEERSAMREELLAKIVAEQGKPGSVPFSAINLEARKNLIRRHRLLTNVDSS